MRSMSLLLLTVVIGGCTPVQPVARSPRAEAQLQTLLAGRVAGPPTSCLSDFRSNNMVVIDDNTVLFRDGRTIYRNDFQGSSCSNLGNGNYALVTRRIGGIGLCRGDISEVRDLANGTVVGSCVIGEFVPYTKPR